MPKPIRKLMGKKRPRARVISGDVLQVLPRLPADHFHCVITSPPYFALRSYLDKDDPLKPLEIGGEPAFEAYIETMVRVFREVRRVMHPSGLLFLNMGDSYRGEAGIKHKHNGERIPRSAAPGQLLNMPHRIAEALRVDGWLWRQTIVWAKKSPMPEGVKGWRWERCRVKIGTAESEHAGGVSTYWRSVENPERLAGGSNAKGSAHRQIAVWQPCPGCLKCEKHGGYVLRKGRGRCTIAHEYLFVLSKNPEYFWDSAAFVEEGAGFGNSERFRGSSYTNNRSHDNSGRQATDTGGGRSLHDKSTRNPRSVWVLSSEPTSVPHFATFPSELVRRCIQAGASDGGCCSACGEPYAPIINIDRLTRKRPNDRTAYHNKPTGGNSCGNTAAGIETTILGYRPTCECGCGSSPCRVLDPFTGIGTTLQTAKWMNHEATGIELNSKYIVYALEQISKPPRWWKKREVEERKQKRLQAKTAVRSN